MASLSHNGLIIYRGLNKMADISRRHLKSSTYSLYFDSDLILKVVPGRPIEMKSLLVNGLVPNGRQATTQSNNDHARNNVAMVYSICHNARELSHDFAVWYFPIKPILVHFSHIYHTKAAMYIWHHRLQLFYWLAHSNCNASRTNARDLFCYHIIYLRLWYG